MESFFHTLKTELVHHRQYATHPVADRGLPEQAKKASKRYDSWWRNACTNRTIAEPGF
jgi:hypothetical protein